jgi:hypothetical protein
MRRRAALLKRCSASTKAVAGPSAEEPLEDPPAECPRLCGLWAGPVSAV